MKVLFIGGSGIISTACVSLALQKGHEVTALNRGNGVLAPGCSQIVCDVNDAAQLQPQLADSAWDVVVDFLSFTPDEIERRIASFAGKVGHYIFISSASAYQ